MRRFDLLLIVPALVACTALDGGSSETPTSADAVDPGDQPIAEPSEPGMIPEPRPPIPGNIDGPVMIASSGLRIMESFPIQVMVNVEGEKPNPCHEIFRSVEDTGEAIEIEMISQTASDQNCAQVIKPFIIAVPLGRWQGESREVMLNGDLVGSFAS
ncbi:MAG: hypothetical protein ACRDWA_17280 [Acidimicrobiia bacterium]